MKAFTLATLTVLVATAALSRPSSAAWNSGDLSNLDMDSFEAAGSQIRVRTAAQRAEHARRRVQIVVHKSMKEKGYQFLTVAVDGEQVYETPVSTAWERKAEAKTRTYQASTPAGKFLPDGMQDSRFSNTWQVSLKYVIRFNGGIWLHATTPDHYSQLGAPASGGCIRMHETDALQVYRIVSQYGLGELAITVLGADADESQLPWKNPGQTLAPNAELREWMLKKGIRYR
jgi:hypothetical protein